MYDNIKYFENTQYKHKSFQGYFLYVIMNRTMVLALPVDRQNVWEKISLEKRENRRKPAAGEGTRFPI